MGLSTLRGAVARHRLGTLGAHLAFPSRR